MIRMMIELTMNSIGRSPITSQFKTLCSPFLTLTLMNFDSKKGGTRE